MTATLKPAPNAALLLADGTVFFGMGVGAHGSIAGEVCFNTAMTGYQEVLTDPSYMGQIITFTFPHIGNVGCNDEDIESSPKPVLGACGLILREHITDPSNFRAGDHFNAWLTARGITGICGVDTRALTRHIRDHGAQNAAIVFSASKDLGSGVRDALLKKARAVLENAPDMNGLELAAHATTREHYRWSQKRWALGTGYPVLEGSSVAPNGESRGAKPLFNVVAIDFGEKLNILRCLASAGCQVTVVPGTTPATDILKLAPDGVFLSNGPGDPAATANYAVPTIRALIDANVPVFGICLGHQLLGLALGARTEKMKQGHRGANHPVKDLATGKVEITSQNHGFCVCENQLPDDVEITHRSLFDNSIEGLRHKTKPAFSVQYHPESSPGPHDSHYLFDRFVELMGTQKKRAA
jgi:carbamoyl-phosphate synthase small subunit